MVYDGALGGPAQQPSTTPNHPSTGGTGPGAGGPNAADGHGTAGTGAEEAGSHYDAAPGAGHEDDGKTGTRDQPGSLVGDAWSSNGIASLTRLLIIC